jgi:hypothetical protein
MAAIISKSEILMTNYLQHMVLKWLNPLVFLKKKTKDKDYKFPMQLPYIVKPQEKYQSLIKELKESDHKYQLTKIECTAVLTLYGKKYLSRTQLEIVSSRGIVTTFVTRMLRAPNQQSEALRRGHN